jgi:hypothetical protein
MTHDCFPSLDEIYERLDQFVSNNFDIAWIESLGLSAEDREIKAVYITDKNIPTEEKEVAIAVCGRHGNELGTRIIGPALLDWLASEEGEKTRRHQLVIVVPVANSAGCVREEFWAPKDKLSETEKNTIGEMAKVYQPDAVMDIHSWGGILDGEAIVTANTYNSGEDVFIHESIAAKMTKRAAEKGYPFLIHRSHFSGAYNNFYCGMCYESFHSLVFGMEVNHSFLDSKECAESGMAVIEAFLEEGNTRSPWEPVAGYPNRILLGDFFTSIRAAGVNGAERRKSRFEIWKNRELFKVPQREFLPPNAIRVKTGYSGEALPCSFALVCRIRGFCELKTVRLNDKNIESTTYRDNCSTFASLDIHPSGKEEYEVLIEF